MLVCIVHGEAQPDVRNFNNSKENVFFVILMQTMDGRMDEWMDVPLGNEKDDNNRN